MTDLLHPTGRCSCAGEGRCDWCRRTALAESLATMEAEWDAARAALRALRAACEECDEAGAHADRMRALSEDGGSEDLDGKPIAWSEFNVLFNRVLDRERVALADYLAALKRADGVLSGETLTRHVEARTLREAAHDAVGRWAAPIDGEVESWLTRRADAIERGNR